MTDVWGPATRRYATGGYYDRRVLQTKVPPTRTVEYAPYGGNGDVMRVAEYGGTVLPSECVYPQQGYNHQQYTATVPSVAPCSHPCEWSAYPPPRMPYEYHVARPHQHIHQPYVSSVTSIGLPRGTEYHMQPYNREEMYSPRDINTMGNNLYQRCGQLPSIQRNLRRLVPCRPIATCIGRADHEVYCPTKSGCPIMRPVMGTGSGVTSGSSVRLRKSSNSTSAPTNKLSSRKSKALSRSTAEAKTSSLKGEEMPVLVSEKPDISTTDVSRLLLGEGSSKQPLVLGQIRDAVNELTNALRQTVMTKHGMAENDDETSSRSSEHPNKRTVKLSPRTLDEISARVSQRIASDILASLLTQLKKRSHNTHRRARSGNIEQSSQSPRPAKPEIQTYAYFPKYTGSGGPASNNKLPAKNLPVARPPVITSTKLGGPSREVVFTLKIDTFQGKGNNWLYGNGTHSRQIDVVRIHQEPDLFIMPDFLTNDECDSVLDLWRDESASPHAYANEPSSVMSMQLRASSHPLGSRIERRIAAAAQCDPSDIILTLEILKYKPQSGLGPHMDSCSKNVLIFLNNVNGSGGDVAFLRIGLQVHPKRATALMWSNTVGESSQIRNELMVHCDHPTEQDHKAILLCRIKK